jgi:hypothetical protein
MHGWMCLAQAVDISGIRIGRILAVTHKASPAFAQVLSANTALVH